MSAGNLNTELASLNAQLGRIDYRYRYEGDRSLETAFGLRTDTARPFVALKDFYRSGTLVIHQGLAGIIGHPAGGKAEFQPFDSQRGLDFYKTYIRLRDTYQ